MTMMAGISDRILTVLKGSCKKAGCEQGRDVLSKRASH